MPKKFCNKCEQKKPLDDFYDPGNTCKDCKKKYTKDKYWANKDAKEKPKKTKDDQSDVGESDDENKKLKKRVKKLEKKMVEMNTIISQQKKEIDHISALIESFTIGLKEDQEEELDEANIVELSE